MGDALRWLLLAHLAYAAGILPWALVLAVALRIRRPLRAPGASAEAWRSRSTASWTPAKLPQPPLMDVASQAFDPAPPAWVPHVPSDLVPESPPAYQSPAEPTPTGHGGDVLHHAPHDRRLALAETRDLARSALLRLAASGYFAFEDLLVSGVGAIDQLVVGPAGVHVIVVAPERGYIWREAAGEITYSTDARVDLEAGTIEGSFEHPDEDLDAIARTLVDDLSSKLGTVRTTVLPLVVFPHAAEVYYGPGGAHGLASAWNLAEVLDHPGDRHLSPEAAEDIVAHIAGAYGREPWMRPTPDNEPCPDA